MRLGVRHAGLSVLCFTVVIQSPIEAQLTNNTSTVTNSAAPAASSTTTGGTNINYQTNSGYDSQNGFGPGVFCRTPMIQMGGNWGQNKLDAYDPVQTSGNAAQNYTMNIGLNIPFGSSVLDDCKRLVAAIARDREISSQLSMLRTCATLKKEGLVVDPIKFPMLHLCVDDVPETASTTSQAIRPIQVVPKDYSTNRNSQPKPALTPKTNRLL